MEKEIAVLREKLASNDNVLQEQLRTIEALTMGMDKYGLHGTTPVIVFIARLENELAEAQKTIEGYRKWMIDSSCEKEKS